MENLCAENPLRFDIQHENDMLRDQLNLGNWDITLILEPAFESDGGVKTVFNDYKAIIKIKAELSYDEKLVTLTHEMLHIVFRDSYDIARENLDDTALLLFNRFNERAIEQLAQSIYRIRL